jgi:hypothetical protein
MVGSGAYPGYLECIPHGCRKQSEHYSISILPFVRSAFAVKKRLSKGTQISILRHHPGTLPI